MGDSDTLRVGDIPRELGAAANQTNPQTRDHGWQEAMRGGPLAMRRIIRSRERLGDRDKIVLGG